MRTILKGGKVLTLNKDDLVLEVGDILINGEKIEEIAENIVPNESIEKIIDVKGKLLIPGLVNAHLHSDEKLFSGLLDNLPLELWMLYSCPPLAYGPFDDRLIYLRTMLAAIEMVKNGITCAQDDVSEVPVPTISGYNSVFKAYEDIGMRANVALNMNDKSYLDKLPYTREIIPLELQQKLNGFMAKEDLLEIYKETIRKWNGRSDLKVVISSSAPQRCTDGYLMQLDELSRLHDLPMHTHILETKTQVVTGNEFYGKSIIQHAHEIGFLSERLTIIHSIWVTDEDIEIMGDAGVSVAHNPISNLKLGSGIMPLRKLINAGVNVTLGTDGASSSDSLNIFEVMKSAALLHKVTNPEYKEWPTSNEVLRMATHNAAYSTRRMKEIGSLEKGKKADITILNLKSPAFTPLNDLKNHLVYCENGSSVDSVIIGGKFVLENGKLLTVNEEDILEEINELMPSFKEKYHNTVIENEKLFPYIDEIYWRCMKEDIGMNRFSDFEA